MTFSYSNLKKNWQLCLTSGVFARFAAPFVCSNFYPRKGLIEEVAMICLFHAACMTAAAFLTAFLCCFSQRRNIKISNAVLIGVGAVSPALLILCACIMLNDHEITTTHFWIGIGRQLKIFAMFLPSGLLVSIMTTYVLGTCLNAKGGQRI